MTSLVERIPATLFMLRHYEQLLSDDFSVLLANIAVGVVDVSVFPLFFDEKVTSASSGFVVYTSSAELLSL